MCEAKSKEPSQDILLPSGLIAGNYRTKHQPGVNLANTSVVCSCATGECIRILSLGHFSRTELVRSFVRTNSDPLPTVYEIRISGGR
jgi:hypothetical protein